MPVPRIFLCYKAKDANFATKLINDLQDSGAEIITDSTDLSDRVLEHLLTKELPSCQQLIIIQTPSAVRSSHVQTIVSAALKYVQQGKMEGIIRVIAPTLNGGDPQVVPLMWAKIPTFDASQDYPDALERLRLALGLGNINMAYTAPHVLYVGAHDLKEDSGLLSIPALPYSPYPDSLDHPQKYSSGKFPSLPPASLDRPRQSRKYSRISPRLWLIISSIAIALLISTASVAVFVRQASKNVNSTQLPKTSIAVIPTATPTQTPISSPTPTPLPTIPATPAEILTWATSGQPFIRDQLLLPDGNKWSVNTTGPRQCQFTGGSYHASVSSSDSFDPCLALAEQDSKLQNIAFQVQVTITKGDAGGLTFHSDASGLNNYTFAICVNPVCGQGYVLYISEGGRYNRIASGPGSAIKADPDETNLLTVVALHGDIYLYINSVNVAHVNDNKFTSGYIGLLAYEASNSTDVAFSNVQVWKLQG